jgi:fatty acid-binding protein DegV
MLEIAEERLDGWPVAEASVIDTDSPEEGDAVAEQVKEHFGIFTVYRAMLSPVIGTHAGPGTVGFVFCPK